ncbi:MAG: adenylate kinase [Thermoplasmata archaeon]|nr:adenylate kinase [Thermoplasmata archaeon]
MKIIVTGVPGVGKSTIMNGVCENLNYRVVNFGDIMLEKAKELGIKNRDEIRKLPSEKQRELQKMAGEYLGTLDNIIIDTHMSIKTPSGFLPGLPEWVLMAIRPSMLVLIEADPENIENRRKKDSTRYRDDEGSKGIEMHQNMNRYFAAACSVITGATVVIIKNEEGKVNEAVELLSRMIKNG